MVRTRTSQFFHSYLSCAPPHALVKETDSTATGAQVGVPVVVADALLFLVALSGEGSRRAQRCMNQFCYYVAQFVKHLATIGQLSALSVPLLQVIAVT